MIEATISDIDFYQRKIYRLETDLTALQDELNISRIRLRTAQDFQIKYELLLRQSQQENQRLKLVQRTQELKKQEIAYSKVAEIEEKWEKKLKDLEKSLREEHQAKLQKVEVERKEQHQKNHELSQNAHQIQLLEFKFKKSQSEKKALEEQLQQIKIFYETQKAEEILALKTSLIAKSKEKQTAQQLSNYKKIEQLEGLVNGLEIELASEKIKDKPTQIGKTIALLKQQLSGQKAENTTALQEMSVLLRQKNQEIQSLISEKIELQKTLQREKKQQRSYAKQLEDKLSEKEKDHQIELINLKERLIKIREEEVGEIKEQNRKAEQTFDVERSSWDLIIRRNQQEKDKLKHAFDQQRNKLNQDKVFFKKKIEQLKERLKEAQATRQLGDTEQLINSLRDTQNREDHFTSYQNGVTFLERQLKKAIMKLEQKGLEVKKLLKDIGQMKQNYETQQQERRQKFKKEKKGLMEKIIKLEAYSQQLNDSIRDRDREIKKVELNELNKRDTLEAQNKSLKEFNQQLQRDYNRVIESRKSIEKSFRQEREKSIVSKSDIQLTRKDKWLELEKQKNDLHVIFKEKEEQLKSTYEIERDNLRTERDKLKHQNQILKQQKKLQDEQMRNIYPDKQNQRSQRMANYNKKMATVDLELALTQNLYTSLIQAKSRLKRPLQQSEVNSENQLEQSFRKGKSERDDMDDGASSPVFKTRHPESLDPIITKRTTL